MKIINRVFPAIGGENYIEKKILAFRGEESKSHELLPLAPIFLISNSEVWEQ